MRAKNVIGSPQFVIVWGFGEVAKATEGETHTAVGALTSETGEEGEKGGCYVSSGPL